MVKAYFPLNQNSSTKMKTKSQNLFGKLHNGKLINQYCSIIHCNKINISRDRLSMEIIRITPLIKNLNEEE